MNNLHINKIFPLICGGSGTRLWPLSKSSFPKQFSKYNPKNNFSFLQDTYSRLKEYKKYSGSYLNLQ